MLLGMLFCGVIVTLFAYLDQTIALYYHIIAFPSQITEYERKCCNDTLLYSSPPVLEFRRSYIARLDSISSSVAGGGELSLILRMSDSYNGFGSTYMLLLSGLQYSTERNIDRIFYLETDTWSYGPFDHYFKVLSPSSVDEDSNSSSRREYKSMLLVNGPPPTQQKWFLGVKK